MADAIRDFVDAAGLHDYITDTGLGLSAVAARSDTEEEDDDVYSEDLHFALDESSISNAGDIRALPMQQGDVELVRMEAEHAMSMQAMRHERELNELREAAHARERALRRDVRRRDKAIQQAVVERDALPPQLEALRVENAHLKEQLAGAMASDVRHVQQLAAVRAQAAADASSAEVRICAANERAEQATQRAASSASLAESLRPKLEANLLRAQEAEQRASAAQEACVQAKRELGGAVNGRELMGERVKMLQKELERLDESTRAAVALTHQRDAELREVVAALATAREQRNQAAREAETSRLSAGEAHDDLQRSAELVAASDARVANSERRLAQENVGRQRAEGQLADAAVVRRSERARRQRRMLIVLLQAANTQRAVGFARWLAACAAKDADAARRRMDEAAAAVRLSVGRTKEAIAAIDRRDANVIRTSRLGNAWMATLETWLTRRGAASAFGMWAGAARAEGRILRRWERLVRAAEQSPRIVLPRLRVVGGRPPWRMILCQRAARVRLYHKRGFVHQRAHYYDSGRIRRAIFVLWRQWARSETFREACDIAEARATGLHVSQTPPWWEARA